MLDRKKEEETNELSRVTKEGPLTSAWEMVVIFQAFSLVQSPCFGVMHRSDWSFGALRFGHVLPDRLISELS